MYFGFSPRIFVPYIDNVHYVHYEYMHTLGVDMHFSSEERQRLAFFFSNLWIKRDFNLWISCTSFIQAHIFISCLTKNFTLTLKENSKIEKLHWSWLNSCRKVLIMIFFKIRICKKILVTQKFTPKTQKLTLEIHP